MNGLIIRQWVRNSYQAARKFTQCKKDCKFAMSLDYSRARNYSITPNLEDNKTQKPSQGKEHVISIDRSALYNPKILNHCDKNLPNVEKSKETDFNVFLRTLIQAKGPLTVSEFFQQSLSHPKYGYYMNCDVFGRKGDFTTAPEISQMFGELIGIWCIHTWQQMGSLESINIIEIGPGRGTLQNDILRSAKSFPTFYKAINVHMIETSPALTKIQQETLGCVFASGSKPIKGIDTKHMHSKMRIPGGPHITWHRQLKDVPDGPCIIIAQELFDALPIHQFEYTSKGWCERLVDIDMEDGPHHFRFVLSNGPTLAVRAYLQNEKINQKKSNENLHDEEVTGTIGDRLEVCPAGIALVQDISKRIARDGGGALVVDYGIEGNPMDSLRGIKDHKFVHPLLEPGHIDLSADVDFGTLKRFAGKENTKVFGPVGQGQFLSEMGIQNRLESLLKEASEEVGNTLIGEYERLVDPKQMGNIFKAMAIMNVGIDTPAGFFTWNDSKLKN